MLALLALRLALGDAETCSLERGVDYPHHDIARLPNVSSPAECCAHCHANPQCRYFMYFHQPGVTCWLKSAGAGRAPKPGAVSGSIGRLPPPGPPPPTPAPVEHWPGPIPHACSAAGRTHFPFCNTSLGIPARVADLIGRIHDSEKPALLTARHSAAIERLGLPSYDWGVNSLHGAQVTCPASVPRCATNYPTPAALGASFDVALIEDLARMQAVEIRALRLASACENWHMPGCEDGVSPAGPDNQIIGLDTWTPNVTHAIAPHRSTVSLANPTASLMSSDQPPARPEMVSRLSSDLRP